MMVRCYLVTYRAAAHFNNKYISLNAYEMKRITDPCFNSHRLSRPINLPQSLQSLHDMSRYHCRVHQRSSAFLKFRFSIMRTQIWHWLPEQMEPWQVKVLHTLLAKACRVPQAGQMMGIRVILMIGLSADTWHIQRTLTIHGGWLTCKLSYQSKGWWFGTARIPILIA